MRVINVVPAISNEASGPSYSVVRLCESLIAAGKNVTLAALDWAPIEDPPHFLKSFPLGIGPSRLGRSPSMARWFETEAHSGNVSIFHNHGMWQMNAVYPGKTASKYGLPFMVSPRGAWSQWAMSYGSYVKKLFWPLMQKPSMQATSCFHATSIAEYKDIRRIGFRQPVAVIPNGVDIPACLENIRTDTRTLLFLGRIHPVKGLDLLLSAWQALQDRFPEWRLRIVGDDAGYHSSSGYLEKIRILSRQLHLERVEFTGSVRGDAKWREYDQAELFVLPTYSENFGMSVAEALASGTPAVVSKGAPWSGLESHHAGRWIEIGLDPLVAALEELMGIDRVTLCGMGAKGREWMKRDLSWQRIGIDMSEVYDWVSGRSDKLPACVRTD